MRCPPRTERHCSKNEAKSSQKSGRPNKVLRIPRHRVDILLLVTAIEQQIRAAQVGSVHNSRHNGFEKETPKMHAFNPEECCGPDMPLQLQGAEASKQVPCFFCFSTAYVSITLSCYFLSV